MAAVGKRVRKNDSLAHHSDRLGLLCSSLKCNSIESFSISLNSLSNREFVCFFNECIWHSINTLSKQSRQSSSSWYRLDGVECKFSVITINSQSLFCAVIGKFSLKFREWIFRLSMMSRQQAIRGRKNCWLAWRSSSARTDKIATLYFCEIVIARKRRKRGLFWIIIESSEMKMSTMFFDWKWCFRSFSRRYNYKQSDVIVLSPSICDMTWQKLKKNELKTFPFLSSFYITLIYSHYVTTFLPLRLSFLFELTNSH